GLADAGVRRDVLHADVVVLRRIAVAFERGVDRLAFLQFLEVSELVAAGFGEPLEIARGAHGEGELDGEIRPGGFAVDHVEIVFVDAGFDDLAPGVFEALLEHQLRLTLGQADDLLIEVRVARRVAQFLGEFDAVGELVDGPLTGIRNLVSLELLEGPLLRLAHRGEWALNPGTDRTGSEFPANCAGNSCQSYQSPGSGQLPGFLVAACHILVGVGAAGKAFLRVVPIEALSGTVGDVGEKSALRQAVAVLDIAGAALPRLDGIQKLADMPRRIRNGRRRGTEGLLLL